VVYVLKTPYPPSEIFIIKLKKHKNSRSKTLLFLLGLLLWKPDLIDSLVLRYPWVAGGYCVVQGGVKALLAVQVLLQNISVRLPDC
jgi:hypothetical protein